MSALDYPIGKLPPGFVVCLGSSKFEYKRDNFLTISELLVI